MHVLLIGGTRFIGRAVLRELLEAGHHVTVLHRGNHPLEEGAGHPRVKEILADRLDLPRQAERIGDVDVIVDTCAMKRAHVQAVADAYGVRGVQLTVVLSSIDVYEAFAALHACRISEPVPLRESSRLRTRRYLFAQSQPEKADVDNLDVEDTYVASPSLAPVILRLPVVYGPHDYYRREWPWLQRVVDRRTVVPMSAAWIAWLFHRVYVGDVARAVMLCLERPEAARGEIFNVGEPDCLPWGTLASVVGELAGQRLTIRPVDEELLPPHLHPGPFAPQPLLISTDKIRRELGYREARSREEDLAETVRWHLTHPPPRDERGPTPDYEAEERLLQTLEMSFGSEQEDL